MARLTEDMVVARSKQSDLAAIKKLNCWGAELGDVSVLRRMPNVEVLAFSVNKLTTLRDFGWCQRLRELYVRRNEVRELSEVRHLRRLAHLASLWLDENPCTQHPLYRYTVLRTLPHLEKLDNITVDPDEVAEAQRRGLDLPDSDDEGYAPQTQQPETELPKESYIVYRSPPSPPSAPPSPEPGPDQSPQSPEWGDEPGDSDQWSPRRRSPERCPPPVMTRSHYEPRPCSGHSSRDDPSLRHSYSAQSVKEYASNKEYTSAVMAERTGFTRRPVARSSNLLSAVLCLVKELDYPALEVAEMAVRCRMDELASSEV